MKIIIDIDDNLYTRLFDNGVTDAADLLKAHIAIRKGTVLPKGHGDLKDIAEIERLWQKGDYDSIVSALLFAPTIIEADKEVENEFKRPD